MGRLKKIGSLTPVEKARLISGCIFFVVYFGLGIMFLSVKSLPFAMSPTIKAGFGIILVAYSIYRLARIIGNLKNAGESNV